MTKQIDLDPKNVRRVVQYPPFFFVYVPIVALIWFGYLLYASGWNWGIAFGFGMPAFALGAVVGIRFRDAP